MIFLKFENDLLENNLKAIASKIEETLLFFRMIMRLYFTQAGLSENSTMPISINHGVGKRRQDFIFARLNYNIFPSLSSL